MATAREGDRLVASDWPAHADADIGVLCVHGIGVQAEGETLLAVAQPLLDELTSEGARVTLGETILKPRAQLDAGPARMSATVAHDVDRNVLLAESWWAGVFDAPSYWNLVGWLLTYGTWIAIRHAVFSLCAPLRYFEARYMRAGEPRPEWMGYIDVLLAYPATFASLFFVALPMQWLLLVMGVVAILPFGWAKQIARKVALSISAVLGDASVFTADATVRQAIVTRVRDDLDWLAARCGTVVVLAHSQGAAVVYEVLRSFADLRKIRLVTYGEGIRKLTELEEDARTRPLIVSVCGVLWLLGLLFVVIAWFGAAYVIQSFATPGATAIGDRVGSLLLFYVTAFVLLSPLLYHTARGREKHVDDVVAAGASELLGKNLQWIDLYASSDPVPGGPLLGARATDLRADGWRIPRARDLRVFRSREIVNLRSTIADHTAYWKTPNDFVPLVAGVLREWSGLPAAPALPTGRGWRMALRKVAGLAITVAAATTFVRAGDPLRDIVWVPVSNMVSLDPASITARLVVRYGLRDTAAYAAGLALYVALAFAYVRLVLDPAWSAWARAIRNAARATSKTSGSWVAALTGYSRVVAPWMRAAVCAIAVVLPLWILAAAIAQGDYALTLESVVRLGEWGREAIGWLVWTIALVAIAVAAIGLAAQARDWWIARRGSGS
jgi:hypothetical protein